MLENRKGLSAAEVAERLREEGYNELPSAESKGFWKVLISVMKEPMLLLLFASAALYLVIGDIQEGIILMGASLLVIGITIYQENKTERTLQALRELATPSVMVIRDGNRMVVNRKEIVRDDLIVLQEGERVAADALVLESQNLAIDESMLTGESIAVSKSIWQGEDTAGNIPGGNGIPNVYFGTMVVSGNAVARVYATGRNTELGKIGKSLASIATEETLLNKEVGRLTKVLGILGVGVCLIVITIYGFLRHMWIKGILAGLALAMSMLPEEFPVVLTIFLSIGAWRIARKNVLTRRVSAIETLGAATVLCTDKTGTITQNSMMVQRLYTDPGYLEINDKEIPEAYHTLLEYAVLGSQKNPFDPMERAIQKLGEEKLYGTEHLHQNWELVREYPLSPSLLSVSEVWRSKDLQSYVIAAKGAPEAIIDLCHLDAGETLKAAAAVKQLAEAGLRVLGVAKAQHCIGDLSADQHQFAFVFLGLIGLADPIRDTVPPAILECQDAHIKVIMISGDYPATTVHIARQIGLDHPEAVMTGEQLRNMPEDMLARQIGNTSIFSRVTPDQKLRIVNALKAQGQTVAMTGDGVNDAPALKAAHIGIAMGKKGTDVAREASALILLDDDFSSIVAAIRLGRRIFVNLQKAMSYVMAIHIPIAGLSLIPLVAAHMPLVFTPVHIVFLELIIDPACSIVFEAEPEDKNIMKQSPRALNTPIMDRGNIIRSIFRGTSILVMSLAVYFYAYTMHYSELDVRTLCFSTLIAGNLLLIFSNLSAGFMFRRGGKRNPALRWLTAGNVMLLIMILYVPFFQNMFHFSTLHPDDLLVCAIAVLLGIGWLELFRIVSGMIRR